MATGFEDFGGYSVGSLPGDFALSETNDGAFNDCTVEALAASLSGKALKIANDTGGNYRGIVRWTAVADIPDGEVTILCRIPFQTGTEIPYTAAMARGTVAAGPAVTLVGAKNDNRFDRTVLAYGNGSTNDPLSGFLTSATGITQANDERWYIRFNFNGTAYKVRMWKVADAEPGAWDIDTTSATPSATDGKPGVAFGLTASTSEAWIEGIGYSDDPGVEAPLEGTGGGGSETNPSVRDRGFNARRRSSATFPFGHLKYQRRGNLWLPKAA